MVDYLRGHKKLTVILAIVFSLVLLGLYLWALLRPGIWYEDTFLYRQKDGSYAGSAGYADFELHVAKAEGETQIRFRVNDLWKDYRVRISGTAVTIFAQDLQIFAGQVQSLGDYSYLTDADGEMIFLVEADYGGVVQDPEELLPNSLELYSWAAGLREDTRGKPEMLVAIGAIALILALDIAFPDLFFILKYRMAVDGGEPSDFYRSGQIIGRFVGGIAILVGVLMSFYH